MVEIAGFAPPRFAAVKDAFAANFAAGAELGARFSLVEAGELVVDLWAGHADRARTRPFDARTLTAVFSTTKAIAALLLYRTTEGASTAAVSFSGVAGGAAPIAAKSLILTASARCPIASGGTNRRSK